jgi:hypothetical protein
VKPLLVIALLASTALAAPIDDPRLGSEALVLKQLIADAQRNGLPVELLTAKIGEGLAKGVPAPRITGAVRTLAGGLGEAKLLAGKFVPLAPPGLLKAIVDARALGAGVPDLEAILKAASQRGASQRAIEVLGDLIQRGFPPGLSSQAVKAVTSKDPRGLDPLPAQAEGLARRVGVTRAEALDALVRAVWQGISFDQAAQLLRIKDPALQDNDGHGPPRESWGPHGPTGNNGHGKER